MSETNQEGRDAFEFGDEPVKVEINIRGKTRAYLLVDIPASESDKMFMPLLQGNEEQKKRAQREFRDKVISKCVRREDGSEISIEDARQFRTQLAVKLSAAALEFLNLSEDDAKNG